MKKLLSVLLASATALTACAGLAACGGDSKTITVWAPDNAIETYNALAEEFKAAHPEYEDYTIRFSPKGEGDTASALITDPAKGADIFFFEAGQIRDLLKQNLLQPLSGDFASIGNSVKSRDIDSYVQPVVRNNIVYAFPTTSDNGWFMWYDSEWAEQYHVDMTDLDDIVSKSKSSNRQIVFPYNNGWYVTAFFFGTGCTLDYNDDGTYTADIAGPAGQKAGKAIVKYFAQANNKMANNQPCFYAPGDNDLNTAAATGITDSTVSCGFIGTWVSGDMPTKAVPAACPQFTVDGQKYYMSSFSGGKYCGVNPRRKNKELSVALADFFTNQAGQQARFDNAGAGPTNKVVADSDGVKNNAALNALIKQNNHAYAQLAQPQTMWDAMTSMGTNLANGEITAANCNEKLSEIKDAIEACNN